MVYREVSGARRGLNGLRGGQWGKGRAKWFTRRVSGVIGGSSGLRIRSVVYGEGQVVWFMWRVRRGSVGGVREGSSGLRGG
jgi:hypothetical protein